MTATAVSHPVYATVLGQYVARNHADTNQGFIKLFRVSRSLVYSISLVCTSLLTAVRESIL